MTQEVPSPRLEDRGRTAMKRHRASRPIALAIAEGLLTKETSVCDYGCGHGGDVRYLRNRGYEVCGWDPVHRPRGKLRPAWMVNLGYVLNVIEDPRERAETLTKAYGLCERVLVVSVRVDRTLESNVSYADGYLTRRGTFQKIFKQAEFLSYIERVLSKKAYPASLGIAFVFKDEGAEADYLARRAFSRRLEYRADLIEEFGKNRTARKLVRLANELGRVPLPSEFSRYEALCEAFGSRNRVERLLLRHIDRSAFAGSQEQRREDILTYLAMLRLRGVTTPRLRTLPESVRADIKAIWSSYAKAREEAQAFLFSLGKPEVVRSVCEAAPIGKLVGRDLYFHTSAEDDMPALVRLVVFAGKQIVGEVRYNLIKVATDGRTLSFLYYEDFDDDPHPGLKLSVRVYLPKADYSIRQYAGHNVPILHRKETMVGPDYPHHEMFRRLTEKEEQLGLLGQKGIGYREGWEKLLSERNVELESM